MLNNNGTIFNHPWTTFRPGWWYGNHKVHVSDLTTGSTEMIKFWVNPVTNYRGKVAEWSRI